MRPLIDMQTIQIEITNACHVGCSNCTRLVGHAPKPFMMDIDLFKTAVDSMAELPSSCLVGVMGGEPLLNPHFEAMCDYLHEKIPPERTGLWTCFPKGYEHYREIVCRTFSNVFLNDHTRNDVLHTPVLVPSADLNLQGWFAWYLIDKCFAQNTWSASINPKGAWFCEIAASLAMVLDRPEIDETAWSVEPGRWRRSPKD